MSDPTINDVPRVALEVHIGASLRFGAEWWADAEQTVAVPVASVLCTVKAEPDGAVLLDIGAHASIASNIVSVDVDDTVTGALDPLDKGVWDFILVSADGETKKVARGPARIHRSVSA